MKHQNIFWGVLLILLGTLFLFDRLGFFVFDWPMVRQLWPVLLILWGVSILPVKGFIKLILALLIAAISLVIYNHKAPDTRTSWNRIEFNRGKTESESERISQSFNKEFEEGIKRARLKLDAGAGAFTLNSKTDELIIFDKSRSPIKYEFRVSTYNDEAQIEINQVTRIQQGKSLRNTVDMHLHPLPIWDLEFNIGAGSFEFDFSKLKVERIELNGGAASIEYKLGKLHPETKVEIDAAASSIKLSIPKGTNTQLNSSSVLSSKSIPGMERISRGIYRTQDHDAEAPLIQIELNTAVSSFTIDWY